VCIALPFVVNYPREYFARAFEFGRVFIFKWSVNWKFLSPEFFTSPQFAAALLATHAMLLLAITVGVWSRPFGTFATVLRRGLRSGRQAGPNFLDPDYIIFIMFSCNLIGIVCARTLHYQFYSWYCHTLPYLMFLKPLPFNSVLGSIALLAIVEWCWNIFPATPGSSLVLLAAHAIVLRTLFSVQFPPQPPPIKRD
ncbi:dolichyl-P-Man:Man(5)GlcNAc(2)-PP-dolichol alpha-1,3-mannosyltransferase, partial [Spiromyces aspiralis]